MYLSENTFNLDEWFIFKEQILFRRFNLDLALTTILFSAGQQFVQFWRQYYKDNCSYNNKKNSEKQPYNLCSYNLVYDGVGISCFFLQMMQQLSMDSHHSICASIWEHDIVIVCL